MSVVQLRVVFTVASVHEGSQNFSITPGVSAVALLVGLANSETELIGRVRGRTFEHAPGCRQQLGTSQRNTMPRICSCQLQHPLQQRLLSRFVLHWVPRRVKLRRTNPHGTRHGCCMRARPHACSLPSAFASCCETGLRI